jgi:hypothetical protein
MKKTLKRWGNNLVIVFTKEEEELYGLVEKDTIELEDMLFQKKEEK